MLCCWACEWRWCWLKCWWGRACWKNCLWCCCICALTKAAWAWLKHVAAGCQHKKIQHSFFYKLMIHSCLSMCLFLCFKLDRLYLSISVNERCYFEIERQVLPFTSIPLFLYFLENIYARMTHKNILLQAQKISSKFLL